MPRCVVFGRDRSKVRACFPDCAWRDPEVKPTQTSAHRIYRVLLVHGRMLHARTKSCRGRDFLLAHRYWSYPPGKSLQSTATRWAAPAVQQKHAAHEIHLHRGCARSIREYLLPLSLTVPMKSCGMFARDSMSKTDMFLGHSCGYCSTLRFVR